MTTRQDLKLSIITAANDFNRYSQTQIIEARN